MRVLRIGLAVLAVSGLVASGMTARYDGAWLLGLAAAGALVMTFALDAKPAREHTGGLPDLMPVRARRWEWVLAVVVSPLLMVVAVGLLAYGVSA